VAVNHWDRAKHGPFMFSQQKNKQESGVVPAATLMMGEASATLVTATGCLIFKATEVSLQLFLNMLSINTTIYTSMISLSSMASISLSLLLPPTLIEKK
jgi:hypothetical protein